MKHPHLIEFNTFDDILPTYMPMPGVSLKDLTRKELILYICSLERELDKMKNKR